MLGTAGFVCGARRLGRGSRRLRLCRRAGGIVSEEEVKVSGKKYEASYESHRGDVVGSFRSGRLF
jgi:hypothetical protein